jgi:hypothetical protein
MHAQSIIRRLSSDTEHAIAPYPLALDSQPQLEQWTKTSFRLLNHQDATHRNSPAFLDGGFRAALKFKNRRRIG